MADKRFCLVTVSMTTPVTVVALLFIYASLSSGQSTLMDYDQPLSATATQDEFLNDIKDSMSGCVKSRNEINMGFREINATIVRMVTSLFSNKSRDLTLANEIGSQRGCTCSAESSFNSEIRDKLMELRRDVMFIKSREEIINPRNITTAGIYRWYAQKFKESPMQL